MPKGLSQRTGKKKVGTKNGEQKMMREFAKAAAEATKIDPCPRGRNVTGPNAPKND